MFALFDPKSLEVSTFRSELRGICGQFDVTIKGTKQQLQGSVGLSHTNTLDVAFVAQNANMISRDVGQIRRDPGDHFFLVIQHLGTACMSQGGRDTWLKPGDMFVTDATQPSEFYYGGQYSEQISLHLPRADILHRFGSRIKGGLSISAKEDLACAMQSILHKLLSPSEVCQSHVLEAFYSVFGAILTDRNLTAGRKLNPDRQIYMRALEAMSHHYNDPNFSTADLAEQLEISLRQLQRAFMLVAETPHSRLQRMRIENAHAALLRLGDQQTITSVAFEHGFSDLSTFYRHFKSQFGITPKQLITQ